MWVDFDCIFVFMYFIFVVSIIVNNLYRKKFKYLKWLLFTAIYINNFTKKTLCLVDFINK
jgi:hypothetical protein